MVLDLVGWIEEWVGFIWWMLKLNSEFEGIKIKLHLRKGRVVATQIQRERMEGAEVVLRQCREVSFLLQHLIGGVCSQIMV